MAPARANRVVLRWRPQRAHRCAWCGRWVGLGAEAGYGWGARWCESCFLAAELRRAAVRVFMGARTAALSGAA